MMPLVKTIPLLPAAATLLIFLLDLLSPLGVNLWMFYLIPFLLVYQSHRSRFLVAMAVTSSFLALAGFFLSPGGLDPVSETINRTMGVGVLWMSVVLLLKFENSETERSTLREQTQTAGRQVENILETISDAFVALDKDWRYTYMNRKAGEIFGRDPKQMIGKHIWTEFPEGVGQPFHRAYEQAMAEQQFRFLEEYYPPYDRWFENRMYPSEEGLTIFFTDITDRKKAEQEFRKAKELYQDLVETSQDLIWRCDAEGRFTYLNRAWEQTHSYAIEEMIGKTFMNFQSPEYAERDMREFSRLMQGNMVKNFETVHLAKGGREVHLSFNAKFYFDKEGKISGTMGTAHDITERKRHESLVALESHVLGMVAQQEPLARILERIVLNIEALSQETIASILLLDPDGVHVHYGAAPHLPDSYNRAIEGAPIGPVAGSCGTAAYRKEAVIVTDIETDPLWENYRDLILPHGLRACWSTPIINKQGSVLGTFAMYYKKPRSPRPEDFKLIEFVTNLALITLERTRAEEALRKSEETFSVIFKKAPFAAGLTNIPDSRYLEVNEEFERIFGFTREEIIGKTSLELGMHPNPEVRERSAELFRRQGFVHNLDMRLQTKTGEIRDVLINSDLVEIAGVKYILTTANDITGRRQAEEALKESEERLRLSANAANIGLWDWNLETNAVYFSPEWKSQIGYRDDEIRNDFAEWQNRVHPDDVQPTLAKVQAFLANPMGKHTSEFRFRHKDGSYRWIYTYADVMRGADGKPVRMLGCHLDITERKRTEETVEAHRKLLETVVNHIPSSVSLLRGSDLRVQLVNPAYQAIAPGKEMIGKTWDELWPETGQDFAAICRHVLETGEPYHVVDELNMIRRTPEGAVEPAYFSWSLYRIALPDNNGWGLLGTAWETTARKQAEEEIRHSREQLRALTGHLQTVIEEERGRIAREIHDDIGQIFTAIKMDLSLLLRSLGAVEEKKSRTAVTDEIHALIGLLDRGVQSIRKIVRDLRPEALETMGLLAGIEWQGKEFEKRTKVRVSLSLPNTEPSLEKQQSVTLFRIVQEALTNIARHAEASKVTIEFVSGSAETRLAVTDDGKGILDDAFTKPGSFGLIAMRERVVALGGELTISGKPGKGTKVEVVMRR